jgi:anti-sigma regulatory factor (Ser/Thr protein kinase)
METQVFEPCRIPLRPGNLVLAYSDGITEAKNPGGGLFGEERLFDSIRRNAHLGPTGLVESIRAELDGHMEGKPPGDDITLAVFRIDGDPPIDPPRHDACIELPAEIERLADIRAAVGELLSAYSSRELGERARSMAVLAVSEAASNVIIHGLGGNASESFTLRLEAREEWYSVTFRYRGEDFDWVRDRKSSALDLDESGYGMFIIKNTMQSLVVTRSDKGLVEIILADIPRRSVL